jgi:hypothetical protein
MRGMPMHDEMPEDEDAPPEGVDPLEMQGKLFDDLGDYARVKSARALKSKFEPPPMKEDVPGAAEDDPEGGGELELKAEGELSPEMLEKLIAMLGE